MKKNNLSLFTKLQLPLIAIFVIAVIYGGLLIKDLKGQVADVNHQNQANVFKTNELASRLDGLQNEADQVKTLNSNLSVSLSSAQKKIVALQNQTGTKKEAGITTVYQPAIVTTNTVTKTVIQEVEKRETIQATVTIENIGSFKVDLQSGDNAFEVLKRAASQNNFTLDYDTYSFGVFIKSIGGIAPKSNQYWAFYFNGAFSNVGASDQPVVKGDSIFWQLASF